MMHTSYCTAGKNPFTKEATNLHWLSDLSTHQIKFSVWEDFDIPSPWQIDTFITFLLQDSSDEDKKPAAKSKPTSQAKKTEESSSEEEESSDEDSDEEVNISFRECPSSVLSYSSFWKPYTIFFEYSISHKQVSLGLHSRYSCSAWERKLAYENSVPSLERRSAWRMLLMLTCILDLLNNIWTSRINGCNYK